MKLEAIVPLVFASLACGASRPSPSTEPPPVLATSVARHRPLPPPPGYRRLGSERWTGVVPTYWQDLRTQDAVGARDQASNTALVFSAGAAQAGASFESEVQEVVAEMERSGQRVEAPQPANSAGHRAVRLRSTGTVVVATRHVFDWMTLVGNTVVHLLCEEVGAVAQVPVACRAIFESFRPSPPRGLPPSGQRWSLSRQHSVLVPDSWGLRDVSNEGAVVAGLGTPSGTQPERTLVVVEQASSGAALEEHANAALEVLRREQHLDPPAPVPLRVGRQSGLLLDMPTQQTAEVHYEALVLRSAGTFGVAVCSMRSEDSDAARQCRSGLAHFRLLDAPSR